MFEFAYLDWGPHTHVGAGRLIAPSCLGSLMVRVLTRNVLFMLWGSHCRCSVSAIVMVWYLVSWPSW